MSNDKIIDSTFIFKFFKDYFELKGFETSNVKGQFIKNNALGFDTIIVSISEYESDIILEFHLGKRIDKVEKFAQAYLEYPIDFSPKSMTIICSFARLSNKKYLRYSLQDEADLRIVAKEMDDFLNNRGFRVLEQWSSLKSLNTIYNEDPYSMNMFYNHFTKAVRGVIINKFIGDERYELLQQVYKSIMLKNGVPKTKIDDYERLNTFLKIYSPN